MLVHINSCRFIGLRCLQSVETSQTKLLFFQPEMVLKDVDLTT